MQEIEQLAINNYVANLAYFEKSYHELYKDLTTLDIAINEGLYTEKYSLEYKDGYFDVLEIESNSYLYKEDSNAHAQRLLNMYNTKRTGGVFKACNYIEIDNLSAEYIDKTELHFHNTLWATAKVINYVQRFTNSETYMKKIYKMMFLGVGLGIHLKPFFDKFNPAVAFIKEENLELFRLSLFTTNYQELSLKTTIFFSITNDPEKEKDDFIDFLNSATNYNTTIKHVPFIEDYNAQLRTLQSHVLSQTHIAYGYSGELLRFIDSPKYLVQNYAYMNVARGYYDEKTNILTKKPLLLVFSGPSTLKNIDWLKQNHDKFIILSPLSACRLLNAYGLKPDIMVQIDPAGHNLKLFNDIDKETFFKNTSIILSSNVHENMSSQFDKSKVYMIEQGTNYKCGFGNLSAPTVGEYSYALSLILGAKELYLLGIDLALDENLSTHGSHHMAKKTLSDNNTGTSINKNTIHYIKGNFKELVPSTAMWGISLWQFTQFTDRLKNDFNNVYNLSDGAYLKGATPLRAEDIDMDKFETLNKSIIHVEVEKLLKNASEDHFNKKDEAQLRQQRQQAKSYEKMILKFKEKKFKDTKTFLYELKVFTDDISDLDFKRNSNLGEVYYQYFLTTMSYIYDLFNTKDLANEPVHIKNIQEILCKQLLKMSNLYIKTLSGYLKNS